MRSSVFCGCVWVCVHDLALSHLRTAWSTQLVNSIDPNRLTSNNNVWLRNRRHTWYACRPGACSVSHFHKNWNWMTKTTTERTDVPIDRHTIWYSIGHRTEYFWNWNHLNRLKSMPTLKIRMAFVYQWICFEFFNEIKKEIDLSVNLEIRLNKISQMKLDVTFTTLATSTQWKKNQRKN